MPLTALALAGACTLDRGALPPELDAALQPDTGSCSAELCNGADDDCDGAIDEDFDLESDPLGCGACGNVCPTGPGGAAVCRAGVCGLECLPGRADCDDDWVTGCEASLVAPTSCGACGVVCEAATPLCADDGGGVRCVDSCPGATTLCGASCVDLETDARHCGACDAECPARDGAVPECAARTCGFACQADRADCDGDPESGCEASLRSLAHCGACEVECSVPNATASCASGTCERAACHAGFGDCDGDAANGCERSLRALTDCGGCGVPCDLPGATESCASGSCALVECLPGRGDCDAAVANGCETDLRASDAHCGACGAACPAGQRCDGGTCASPTAVVEVGAGIDFTCARIADGRVYCWGSRADGRLGDGMTAGARTTAEAVPGLSDATALSVGYEHACAIRASGRVVCWGRNQQNQAGAGSDPELGLAIIRRTDPSGEVEIDDAARLASGMEHTCVVRRNGELWCWGRNNRTGGGGSSSGVARRVGTFTDATHAAAGADHGCARLETGGVMCWGNSNSEGQVGDGTTTTRATPVPVTTLADGTAVAATDVTAGTSFTCAIRAAGTVACWGLNGSGQIGDGTTTRATRPTTTTGIADAVEISAGVAHGCVVRSGGGVRCWGAGGNYRLGNAMTANQTAPVDVALGAARGVAAGATHTCAALASGGVVCWGSTPGNGAATELQTPSSTPVAGLP